MTERMWQMIKVANGDYLLPSNDQTTLWRLTRYWEHGDAYYELEGGKTKTLKGWFWATRRFKGDWQGAVERAEDYDDILDWERWDFYSHLCPSRKEAIHDALSA